MNVSKGGLDIFLPFYVFNQIKELSPIRFISHLFVMHIVFFSLKKSLFNITKIKS